MPENKPRIFNKPQNRAEKPLYLSLDYDDDGDAGVFLVDEDGNREVQIAFFDRNLGFSPLRAGVKAEHLQRAKLPYKATHPPESNSPVYRIHVDI